MSWHWWLVELPAQLFDRLCQGYLLLLAAGALACVVTVALWTVLFVAGYPLP